MNDREPVMLKRLLDRLHEARSRRDAEPRFSEAWREADAEMHEIERTVFRSPFDLAAEAERVEASGRPSLHPGTSPSAASREYARDGGGRRRRVITGLSGAGERAL